MNPGFGSEDGEIPVLSIVVPARDALHWLPDALGSVGIGRDMEILVVDDGSTDGTEDYLFGRRRADPRVRRIVGPGRGPSAARNLALEAARAPLVAFLDADDRWRPGKLKAQLDLHRKNPGIGFSFTDYMHVTPDGELRGGCFVFWPRFRARFGRRTEAFVVPDAVAHIYAENVVGTSTVIARRDLLVEVGGFETAFGSAEDWDLWLKLARRAPVGCVPGMLADYLMHRPGNVSGNGGRRATAMQAIAERHRPVVEKSAPWAVKACEARLMVARAEACPVPLRRLGYRVRAAALAPTWRNVREAARAALSVPRGRA